MALARITFYVSVQQDTQRRLRLRTENFLDHFPVAKQPHGGQAADTMLACQLPLFIGVHLGQHELAVQFLDQVLQHRHLHLAGTAPVGPVVDQHGHAL